MKARLLLPTILFAVAASLGTASCHDTYKGPLPRRDQINYPVGLAFHPNGEYLYVVNSNFDARYRPEAGGTVSVIDSDTLEIQVASTPFLPSFGAKIALNDDASRAYVTARASDVVVAYHVAADGSALFCLNQEGQPTSDPHECVIDQVPNKASGAELPSDPFGLAVFSVQRPDVGPVDVINLAHLASSQVSTITLPARELSAATLQTAPLLRGSNAITQRPGTHDLYVAGRRTNGVAIFQPYINARGEVEAIIERGFFVLNHEADLVDARGLVFDDTGEWLYVATRRPDALYFVHIVPANPATGQGREHQVVASIPLPAQPGDIALHTTPNGRQLAYITSYEDESIQVIDLQARAVVDEILLDASPYDIVIEPKTSGCATPTQRCRAFVSLFNDTRRTADSCDQAHGGCGSVAVIDINPVHRDPQHPGLSRYHTVISKIQ